MSEEIVTRRCWSCQVEKPLSEFHKCSSLPSGHHYCCKVCKSAVAASYSQRNKERLKAYQSQYKKENRKRIRAYFRKYGAGYRRTELYKTYRKNYAKLLRSSPEQKDRIRAREALRSAIQTGKIIRPKICSKCGKACKPEAHHYKGYAWENRFEIEWDCKDCHNQAHGKLL